MEMTYFTLILCAALLVGLGLPGLIYFSSRKKKGINEYDVLNRMMRKYRQVMDSRPGRDAGAFAPGRNPTGEKDPKF
jgi:hypothetical protein